MKKYFQNIVLAGVLISAPLYPYYVQCPTTLGNWLKDNFTYQAEEKGKDYWKSPQETVKDKGGDCEDFGLLVQKILKDFGYKTYLIVMYNDTKTGHAICVFQEYDGTYSFFDNQYYYNVEKETMQDIFDIYYKKFDRFYVCTPNKRCKRI